MIQPQKTSKTPPQPQNSPIGPKKPQNDPQKAKKLKIRKQKVLENESYQSIWVNPKKFSDPPQP